MYIIMLIYASCILNAFNIIHIYIIITYIFKIIIKMIMRTHIFWELYIFKSIVYYYKYNVFLIYWFYLYIFDNNNNNNRLIIENKQVIIISNIKKKKKIVSTISRKFFHFQCILNIYRHNSEARLNRLNTFIYIYT